MDQLGGAPPFSGGAVMNRVWTLLGVAAIAVALSACGGKGGD
jgi:hypothetical protein